MSPTAPPVLQGLDLPTPNRSRDLAEKSAERGKLRLTTGSEGIPGHRKSLTDPQI